MRHLMVLLTWNVVAWNSPTIDASENVENFLESHCLNCHDELTPSGGLRLDLLSTEVTNEETSKIWSRVLRRLEAAEMPPQSEDRPPSDELEKVISWTKQALEDEAIQRRGEGVSVTRRLNRLEYENTIHDLLGVETQIRKLLPEDDSVDGFDTSAEGLRISPVHIQSYLEAADLALQDAFMRGPRPESKRHRLQYSRESESRFFSQRSKGRMMVLEDGELRFYCDPGIEHPAYLTQLSKITKEHPGRYKVRVAARTLDPRGEMVSFGIRTANSKQRLGIKTVAWFDAPEEVHKVFETEINFEVGDTIIVEPYRLNMMRRARGFSQYAPGDTVRISERKNLPEDLPDPKGLALGIAWVEVEGPLIEEWPPVGHQRLFGDVPMIPFKKLPKNVLTPGDLQDLRRGDQLTPVSKDPRKDAYRLLKDFLPRAFRRPVSDDEVQRYLEFAAERINRSECFESSMLAAYRAALCSPDFLFIPGPPGKLDNHALASRLSYALWRTSPDESLRKLADDGRLIDSEVLRSETERLLSSPRSEAFVNDFVDQWLGLRKIDATQPDKFLFPEFFIQDGPVQFRDDGLLIDSMVSETRMFFKDLLENDRNLLQFVDSDFTYLNNRLAEFYQLPAIRGSRLQRVSLPEGSVRGGVLTHASVLKVTANGTRTSPVVRGVWVLENILGRHPLPPPPDAGSIDPDTRGTTTIREQLAKHQSTGTCSSCHRQIDPPGFALEGFDPAGQWRTMYRTLDGVENTKEKRPQPKAAPGETLIGRDILGPMSYLLSQPVDDTGELIDGRSFHGPNEYKKLLLKESDYIARTLASKLVTFATGRRPEPGDIRELEAIVNEAKKSDYGLRTLIHSVIQSRLFRTN
ncbi:hypothetical protein KOR42_53710 [Thalassoglobus neptunius]|uniref:Planctomycete cytochrome C n=2 Tax=Thalassoglobus neptunius TaxID=1938619 RepID=A0A5C5V6F7_9PLAN|nr:hypothetical protein KOR42_53710 [Thalassoglobus neptunius]